MKLFFLVSFLGFVILMNGKAMVASEHCSDSTEFRLGGIETRKCGWIRQKESRRIQYCKATNVQKGCPFTCGYCCENDKNYQLITPINIYKCSWLGKKKSRKRKWCGERNNGIMVRVACPVACDFCKDMIPSTKCLNDSTFAYKGDKTQHCVWLMRQEERENICLSSSVSKSCPISCGECCADNPDYSFKTDGRRRTCEWLSKQDQEAQNKYCPQFINKNKVQNACLKTCGRCIKTDNSTERPTVSPTSTPSTSSPSSSSTTPKPTTSTDSPTNRPSSIPTTVPTMIPSSMPSSSPTRAKPNILLILADDVGVGDIKGYWNGQVDTPHLKNLANHGTTFLNAHSTPLCASSRYAILSGNYQYRGVSNDGVYKLAKQSSFRATQMSIAEVLRTQSNYHTGAIGKWHLGGKVAPHGLKGSYDNILSNPKHDFSKPVKKGANFLGFDWSMTAMSGVQGPPYAFFRNDYLVADNIQFWEQGSYNKTNGNSIIRQAGEGAEDWDSTAFNMILVNETKHFLDDHMTDRGTDPFFAYVSLGSVHEPWSPPNFYLNGDPVAGRYPTAHMDMLSEMDMVIGSLTGALEERGLIENTIIIFASDNGGISNRSGSTPVGHDSSGGLRGYKGSVYEGGHRVPFIMRYDGFISAGKTVDNLMGINDLFATLCNIVGVEIPRGQAVDSISFTDYLTDSGITKANNNRKNLGIWRYEKRGGPLVSEAILTPEFKLVHHAIEDTFELYNLKKDLNETIDLISNVTYKHLIKELKQELKRIGPNDA